MTLSKREIYRLAVVAGLLALAAAAWFVLRSGPDRMREIVTVDDAGDTLVYSGPVRDAIARARIIEAFNSVSAADMDGAPDVSEADSAGSEAAARAARQAAVDELARLYGGSAHPDAILGALNLAILAFQPESARPPADAAGFIQAAAEVIDRAPDGSVFVVAGRAPAGADSLAARRAQAVVDALVKAGADPERLRAEGETERRPGGGTAEEERQRGHIVFRLGMAPPDDEAAGADDATGEEDEAAAEGEGEDADEEAAEDAGVDADEEPAEDAGEDADEETAEDAGVDADEEEPVSSPS